MRSSTARGCIRRCHAGSIAIQGKAARRVERRVFGQRTVFHMDPDCTLPDEEAGAMFILAVSGSFRAVRNKRLERRRCEMTVYVDDMYLHALGQFRGMKMSHMIADTEEELHAMAARIGLARRWYQGDHYDVAAPQREAAITLGAVAITMRQLAALAYLQRVGQEMGEPATAIQRMRAHRAAR